MSPKPYERIPCDGYLTFKLSGTLETAHVAPFEKEVAVALADTPLHLVIQCENLAEFSQSWIKCLMGITQDLKTKNKLLRLVLCTEKVQIFLRDNGLNQILKCSPTLRHALVEFGLTTAKALDVNFINPFLEATIKVISIQASIKVSVGKIYRKNEASDFLGDISGVIGLVSEVFNGAVVVTFPESTFLKIMSNMLGETYTEINKDIQDGAAEFTNMIFGQAKTALNEKGYGIKTALPSVIVGKNHSVQSLSTGPHIVVPFESEAGPFFIEVCLSS